MTKLIRLYVTIEKIILARKLAIAAAAAAAVVVDVNFSDENGVDDFLAVFVAGSILGSARTMVTSTNGSMLYSLHTQQP